MAALSVIIVVLVLFLPNGLLALIRERYPMKAMAK